VHYSLACSKEVIGNDPAVAPPPNHFGAHDHTSLLTASFPEPGQAGSEGGCQGIRIVPKAAYAPIVIGRGLSAPRLSSETTTEFGDMLVVDLPRRQRFREALLIEGA
jgi:hypothetical protein